MLVHNFVGYRCIILPHIRHPMVESLGLLIGLSLLLNIVLGTALLGLALSPHLVVVSLTALVAGEAGDGTANSALSAVADTSTKVLELALGLLLLTLQVLFASLGLECLRELAGVALQL